MNEYTNVIYLERSIHEKSWLEVDPNCTSCILPSLYSSFYELAMLPADIVWNNNDSPHILNN